jgi:glucose-1-phosphate adenylyltransferase
MKRIVALILGGGQGKRLFPLTMYRSKPAVPIGGKYRLIDIPVSNCLHSNIKDIYVLTQFNSESLNNHINNTYRFDYFSRAFVRILAAEQTSDNTIWFQGTADAVRKNLIHLDLKGDEEILILSGDHLYEMDYMEFINFHRSKNADFTVSVIPIRQDEAKEFGVLKLNNDDRITAFKEKPKSVMELKGYKFSKKRSSLDRLMPRSTYLASMGVYVFKASVLRKVLETTDIDFGREIIPHSIEKFKGYGFLFNGYWMDVGTIKSFYEANLDMAAYKTHFGFFYKGDVFTRPRFLPTARMGNCKLSHVLVAEGCILGDADIKDSVVGLRAVVGKGCKISRSVLMGADYYEKQDSLEPIKMGIGDGTVIDRAIIDKNARIGKKVTIKNAKNLKDFDGENYYIRDGIVIIPKKAVIKDGTTI